MEEGQGVDDHHQAMGQDVELNPELNPELWKTLPSDLIDIIVKKVLSRLPFSRVRSFCFVCKRWTDILLSMEYLLFFENLYECMLFNPRTGLWESMPLLLLFSQAEVLIKLQHMELESCAGGLLCFASALRDEFIVCNPLTRRYRTLRGPNANPASRRICNDANFLKTRRSYPSGWRVSFREEVWNPLNRTQTIIVNIRAASDTGYFDLLLAKRYQYGQRSVTLMVKDSRRSDWIRVPDVHRDFCFVLLPTFLGSNAGLMLGLHPCYGGEVNVLFYDGEQKECYWRLNVRSLRNAVEMNNQTLFATLNGARQWEFLELRDGGRDGGITLGSALFPPPMEVLRNNSLYRLLPGFTSYLEFSELFNFFFVERGDSVYYISLFRQSPRGQVNISVWTPTLRNCLGCISDWMECRPSTWNSPQLPSSRNFCIFKPSFLKP